MQFISKWLSSQAALVRRLLSDAFHRDPLLAAVIGLNRMSGISPHRRFSIGAAQSLPTTAGEGGAHCMPGSFSRFRRFTFVSRTGFSLSWAAFRGCLIAGRRQRQCGLLFVARVVKERSGPFEALRRTCVAAMDLS